MFVKFDPLAVFWFIVAGIVILRIAKHAFGSYAAPVGIYGSLWCFSLAFFYLGLSEFYTLRIETILVFGVTTLQFLLGAVIGKDQTRGKSAMSHHTQSENLPGSAQLHLSVYALFGLGILGVLAYYLRLNQVIGIESLWLDPVRVRFEESAGDLSRIGWINAARSFLIPSFVLAVMYLSLRNQKPRRLVWVAAVISFLLMVPSSGRTTIMTMVVWAILARVYLAVSLAQKISTKWYAVWLLVISSVCVVYFLTTTNLLGKAVDSEAGLADIAVYTSSSFPAFQEMVREPKTFAQGASLTFGMVSRILNEIDPASFSYPEYVQPTVDVPISTNVYTYLDAFFLDFGWLGVFLFPFVLGLLTTRLYESMRSSPSVIKVYVASLFGLCIVESTGVNRFGNFSTWLWIIGTITLSSLITRFYSTLDSLPQCRDEI
jgi:oligosaccharide repeat unit polymerase